MKTSLKCLATGLSFSLLLAGCNQSGTPVSGGGVTTGLTMTGSGQPAVALSNTQKFFSLFIPSAVALTPPLLVDSTSLSVNLTEAWVVIKEIEFESEEIAGPASKMGTKLSFKVRIL